MKLTHYHSTLAGTITSKYVCNPLTAVNYINMRLNDYAFYKDIVTTPLKDLDEVRSKITVSDRDYIVLQGPSADILPVLYWLSEAKSSYSAFLDSQL